MLSKRFNNDSIVIDNLNDIQLNTRNKILDKINNGIYQFIERNCVICDSNDFKLLSQKDRYGLPTDVVICKQCGLVQINPIMLENNYNDFYNFEYRKLYVGTEIPKETFFQKQYNKGGEFIIF